MVKRKRRRFPTRRINFISPVTRDVLSSTNAANELIKKSISQDIISSDKGGNELGILPVARDVISSHQAAAELPLRSLIPFEDYHPVEDHFSLKDIV